MNPHILRARVLIEQSRFDMAEREIRGALIEDPNQAEAHALLAICLVNAKKYDDARSEAQLAIHLAPDDGFTHYVHSVVLSSLNQLRESKQAIEEAIGLNPYVTEYFAQLGQIELQLRNWKAAELAAGQGLELDPEHVLCTNLRAQALVKQGKNIEAQQSIRSALQRAPEDADSHANMGWSYLEQGQPEKAMEHFREALRLEPEMEWARRGIVEAMKARYIVYRWILNWFLWTAKLRERAQFGLVFGAYIGYTVLRRVAANNPTLAIFINPILFAYVVFAMMTWLSSPLFNLVLRTSKFGRLALSKEEVKTSTWVGVCVLLALVMLITYAVTGTSEYLLGGICFALIVPPISKVYDCDEGWPRNTLALISIGTLGAGIIIATCMLLGAWIPGRPGRALVGSGAIFFFPLLIVSIATQFGINFLISAKPKRTESKGKLVWILGLIGIGLLWIVMIGFTCLAVLVAIVDEEQLG